MIVLKNNLIFFFNFLLAGYVCGEPILFMAEIENRSKRELKDIKVKLVQKVTLRASHDMKTCFRLVSTLQHPNNIPSKTNKNWDGRLGILMYEIPYSKKLKLKIIN